MPRKEHVAPEIGSKFKKRYKGKTHTLEVVKHDSGAAYQVDGKVYLSPSGAATAITKTAINGWVFWGIE
jgi:hypothetical protein